MTYSLQNLKLLAKSYIEENKINDAYDLLKKAVGTHGGDAELWYLLGLSQQRLGKTREAIGSLEKAVSIYPDSVAAHFNLALLQEELNLLTEAAASLEKCLSLDSGFSVAHRKAGRIYQQLGALEKALFHTKAFLATDPVDIIALNRLAEIQITFGDISDAEKTLLKVRKAHPEDTAAVAGLANLLARKGDFEKAYAVLEPYLHGAETPQNIAIAFSSICHYGNKCGDAMKILEALSASSEGTVTSRRNLLVALARLYDKRQDYDRAFKCIAEANSYKEVTCDMQVFSGQTDEFIKAWNADFHKRIPSAGAQIGRPQPVFIVGMARSGSTLIEQILASHPDVYAAGELKELGSIVLRLPSMVNNGLPYPDCLEYASPDTINILANEYLDVISRLSDGSYIAVTDKMPANVWNIGLIKKLFPGAIIIHSKRHPLDTCISNYFTDFADGHTHTYDLVNMGIYYRQYQKIMRHWQQTLGIAILDVVYEELVDDLEPWSRKIIEYCNLPWDDRCLKPHAAEREVSTASFAQVRQKIYSSSIGRWKHYEKYLSPLRNELEI